MKRAVVVMALGACGRISFDPMAMSCFTERPSLVSCWSFDGNTLDVSRNAAHGSATNITYVPGVRRQAVRLTDASVITVPDGNYYNLADATLLAWVRLEVLPPPGERAVIFDNNTQWAFYVHAQGPGCTIGGTTDDLPAGLQRATWHHVACVHDASTGVRITYLDGVRVEVDAAIGVNMSGISEVRIGSNAPDVTSSRPDRFLGDLDELQLLGEALDDQTICAAAGAC